MSLSPVMQPVACESCGCLLMRDALALPASCWTLPGTWLTLLSLANILQPGNIDRDIFFYDVLLTNLAGAVHT